MNRLSSNDRRRQHPGPETEQATGSAALPTLPLAAMPDVLSMPRVDLVNLLPFDLHAEESPDTLPLPGGPVGDDDFDHDGDTHLDDSDDSDDDPPPVNSGALGLPCHSDVSRGPKSPPYTLCVVTLYEDDHEEVKDGCDLIGLQTRAMALACCDGFSLRPDMLATRFKVDPAPYTHLVVNDHKGREVCRRPILTAAA